jgi:putative copper resistance protein D
LSDPLVWARFLHFVATVSLSGLVMFHAFVGAPALAAGGANVATVRLIAGRLARLAWGSLVLAALTGVASLLVQTASMGERPLSALWSDDLVATVLLDTDFGNVWLVRLVLIVLLAAALRPPYFRAPPPAWRRASALALAVAFVASLAFAGHAAAGDGGEGAIHLAADVLHLVAAAAWVGALVPLAIVLAAATDSGDALAVARTATVRFSTLGIASVGTVLATGIVNTFELAGSWAALFGTDYGRLLLLKIALFLAMLAIAAVNRMRLTPQIVAGGIAVVPALRQLRANALTEAVLGALILFIVGALGTLPPGREDVGAAVVEHQLGPP